MAAYGGLANNLQCESKNYSPPPDIFSDVFPKRFGVFSPNFTCLLYYTGLQIFIQLSATLTKLCHIKRDHYYMLKTSTVG